MSTEFNLNNFQTWTTHQLFRALSNHIQYKTKPCEEFMNEIQRRLQFAEDNGVRES